MEIIKQETLKSVKDGTVTFTVQVVNCHQVMKKWHLPVAKYIKTKSFTVHGLELSMLIELGGKYCKDNGNNKISVFLASATPKQVFVNFSVKVGDQEEKVKSKGMLNADIGFFIKDCILQKLGTSLLL